jgi:hypothetical protein
MRWRGALLSMIRNRLAARRSASAAGPDAARISVDRKASDCVASCGEASRVHGLRSSIFNSIDPACRPGELASR